MQARRCCGCRLRLPSPPPGYLRRLAPPASPPPTTSAWSRAVHRRRAHSYQTPAPTLIFRTYPDHLTPHTPPSILPPHYPTPHSPPTPPHPHTTHQPPRGPGSRARLRARARLGTRCHTPRRRGRAPLLPRSHGRRWYEACDPSTARTPAALAMCKACIRYTCAKPAFVIHVRSLYSSPCACTCTCVIAQGCLTARARTASPPWLSTRGARMRSPQREVCYGGGTSTREASLPRRCTRTACPSARWRSTPTVAPRSRHP